VIEIADPQHRAATGIYWLHAHNQILQDLAVGGLMRALPVILLMITLAMQAFKASSFQNALPSSVFVILTFESVSEIPLFFTSVDIRFYLLALVLCAFVATLGQETSDGYPPNQICGSQAPQHNRLSDSASTAAFPIHSMEAFRPPWKELMRSPTCVSRFRAILPVMRLSLASFSATGSTYALFVAVERTSSVETLGMFSLAQTIGAAANQIIDSGLGQYVVRQSVRSGTSAPILSWAFRRRFILVAIFAPIAAIVALLCGFSIEASCLISLLVLGNAWYGFALIIRQADSDYRSMANYQFLNAALYTVGSLLLISDIIAQKKSLVVALAIPVGALAILAALDVPKHRHLFRSSAKEVKHSSDRRQFAGLLLANVVSTHLDSLALGVVNPSVVAIYAASQRPALAVNTLSAAVSNYALPRLSGMAPSELRRVARQITLLTPGVPLAAVFAYLAGQRLLPLVYGTPIASAEVFAVIATAYFIGILTPIFSNSLVALGRTRSVTQVAILQAGIICTSTLIGAYLQSALFIATGILAGRIVTTALSRKILLKAVTRTRDDRGD
jgi:O-antigen/teichoic acid export membrane protein